MRGAFASVLALAALGAPACAAGAALPQVRARAATDLSCAEAGIEIDDLLGGRYRAVGCGRVAYYHTACEGVVCVVRGEGEPPIPWRDRPDPLPVGGPLGS